MPVYPQTRLDKLKQGELWQEKSMKDKTEASADIEH